MKVNGIFSMREHPGKVYSDIVYEWEDDLSTLLNIPIYKWVRQHVFASHLHKFPILFSFAKNILFNQKGYFLRFVMNALEDTPLFNHKYCIPIIIDFFVSDKRLNDFVKIYDKCEYVFITSKQVFDKLSGTKLPFRIVHFPLTLSDRYKVNNDTIYKKKYHLALIGAQINDETLKEYLTSYASENKEFIYVYKKAESTEYHTNTGSFVCNAKTREDYINLLKDSKVVIYSTPGIRGRSDSNNYNQVTPKFLEFVNFQCQIIPRYPINSDTLFYELPKFSESIDTYDAFRNLLDKYMASDIDVKSCNDYMQKHFTSTLIDILEKI